MVQSSFWLATALAVFWQAAVAAEEGPAWTIYHSWNGGQDYTRRGVLEWKGEDEGGLVVTNDENALTKAQVDAMLDFGWYQVKIDTVDNDFVLATVPACNLRRANFKDAFAVTLPRVSGNERQITSLAYTPLVNALAPKTCDETLETPETIQLTSKVEATLDTPGMTLRTVLPSVKPPPGMTWLAHPNNRKGSASKAPGGDPAGGSGSGGSGSGGGGVPPPGAEEEQDAKPWFMKYWYVLLPLALANFMPAADSSKQQEGEGTEGGAAGDAAPAAVAAAPAAGGVSKRARRGKRS